VSDPHSERDDLLEQQQIIVAATRDLIAELAPQELPLVSPISTAYFADPERTLQRRASSDQPLGFGVPAEVVTLLTPIALAVLSEVVAFLVAEIRKSTSSETTVLVNELVRRLFKKLRGPDAAAPAPSTTSEATGRLALSRAQLVQVREIALQKARELGLAGNRAELLADSLVGGLAVAN
jgi:hypothetical protein